MAYQVHDKKQFLRLCVSDRSMTKFEAALAGSHSNSTPRRLWRTVRFIVY